MTTPQQKAAREAIGRMGNIDALALQASPEFKGIKTVLRDLTETLFRPPVVLDTED